MVKRTDQKNDEKDTKIIEANDSLVSPKTADEKNLDKKVGEVDPLTKETREQISSKQLSALQDLISKNEEDEEKKKKLQNLNPNQFRDFLKDNKELTEKAFKDQEFVSRLNNIEIQGYRGIAEKFKDQLQPLKWDGPTGENTRSQEIKGADGKIITTLTEKTIKTPTTIQNEKGENIQVEGYRSVDFPKELKDGGPLHLSLAAKDINGRNIAEDKAVYFTAHYDKTGKLQEVSTPMPVKFMGKGDDAIGYIEREGNVYTLPVTQGKYKEMMREVAINKGMAIDMSQITSIDAKDLAQIKNPEENKIKSENKQQTQSWVKGEISEEARLKRRAEEELRKKNNQTSQSQTPEPSNTMFKLGEKEGQTKEPSKAKEAAEVKSSPIKKVADGLDKNEGPTKAKETAEVKPSSIKKVSEKTDLTDYVNKMKVKLEKKLNSSSVHTTLPKQPKQNKSMNPRVRANSTPSL